MLPVQLPEWNQTEADYPRNSTIADLFKQQAELTPDAIAVVSSDLQLSYRELDERSNRLARHLQGIGVGAETLVGVCMARSETLIVSLLAVLKAGGAYVPLDPAHPQERLSLVIEDSGITVLLIAGNRQAQFSFAPAHLNIIDVDDSSITLVSPQPIPCPAEGHNLAYVLYTSGSTGKPKGVMVEHRNVVNFFTGMDQAIGSRPGVWLAVTSVTFDISVLELLWTITRGFKVVVLGDEGTTGIAGQINVHGVTHLQLTPSLARMLTLDANAFSALSSLDQILLGGEAVPASLIHRIREVFAGELYNMYGPTETTIWSTTYPVQLPDLTVPIGLPIANTQVFVVNPQMQQVPIGETGELLIGGDGVARGYWRRPDLTAERFLTIADLSSDRVYRTGDMVRMLPDGNLEFLGRADFQVKLRGHRIELGEIDAMLEQEPGIRQAVALVREDRKGDQRLVTYLVVDPAHRVSAAALKSALEGKLPEPMIPSAFVFLSAIPLTSNGKIDRKALAELPPPLAPVGSNISQPRIESVGTIERIVIEAWQEALGVSHVGLDDNFFDLGAHSLTVAEVQAKLQNALQREVSLLDLFQFSTVNTLSRHLAGSRQMNALSDRAQRRRLAQQR
jgi:amino acid adenylation domain-containing protein